MNCEDARKLVSAHVDGELRDDRRSDLEGHLRECPSCRREMEETRNMATLLTSALPSFPATLPDRILETLPERSRPRIVALRWAAVAAAAIIPILLLLFFQDPTDPGETPGVGEVAKVGEVEGVKLLLEREGGPLEAEVDVDWGEVHHGKPVENTADVPALMTLASGSAKLAIDSMTRVQVDEHPLETVVTILGDGRVLATLDASRLEKPFVVETASGNGRVRVTALGTVFEVERSADGVEVRVHEGTVRVEDSGGDVRPVSAGKIWAKGNPVEVEPPAPVWTDPAIPPDSLKPPGNNMDLPITPGVEDETEDK